MLKNLFHTSFLILAMLLSGCVSEGDLFDEEFIENTEAVETSLIVSLLNEKFGTKIEDNDNTIKDCFSLKYPVKISYNTNQIVTVRDENGLIEIVNSQTSDFHINSLVFPVIISSQDEEIIIENTLEFNTIFETCNIISLNSTLLNNVGNCFNFQYPITLFNSLQSEVAIENTIDFVNFIENEIDGYIVDFKFPLIINQNETVTNYFDLYQITNECLNENCPEILFETTIDNDTYLFVASGHPESTTANYIWSINGEIIENGLFAGANNEIFSFDLPENGTYNICALIETLDCPIALEYCEEIIVDNFTIGPVPLFKITVSDFFNTLEEPCSVTPVETATFDYVVNNPITANYTLTAVKSTSWFIDGEFITTAETLDYTFSSIGEFTICTEEPCATSCRTFTVEQP